MKTLMTEIRKQTLTLLTAAFAFVAALIWRDAISAWLEPILAAGEGAFMLTMVAIVVTVLLVIATIVLTKFLGEQEEKKK